MALGFVAFDQALPVAVLTAWTTHKLRDQQCPHLPLFTQKGSGLLAGPALKFLLVASLPVSWRSGCCFGSFTARSADGYGPASGMAWGLCLETICGLFAFVWNHPLETETSETVPASINVGQVG